MGLPVGDTYPIIHDKKHHGCDEKEKSKQGTQHNLTTVLSYNYITIQSFQFYRGILEEPFSTFVYITLD